MMEIIETVGKDVPTNVKSGKVPDLLIRGAGFVVERNPGSISDPNYDFSETHTRHVMQVPGKVEGTSITRVYWTLRKNPFDWEKVD